MDGVRQIVLVWRAQAAAWRAHGRRAAARLAAAWERSAAAALTVLGLGGGLGGGALIGEHWLGVMLIAESALVVWLGLMREDGLPLPPRGARTVTEILDEERARPWEE